MLLLPHVSAQHQPQQGRQESPLLQHRGESATARRQDGAADSSVFGRGAAPLVELRHSRLLLQVRPGTGEERRQAILEEWYRAQVREAAPALIARWEALMEVKAGRVFVQRMKTKWGSCNPAVGSI